MNRPAVQFQTIQSDSETGSNGVSNRDADSEYSHLDEVGDDSDSWKGTEEDEDEEDEANDNDDEEVAMDIDALIERVSRYEIRRRKRLISYTFPVNEDEMNKRRKPKRKGKSRAVVKLQAEVCTRKFRGQFALTRFAGCRHHHGQ